MRIKERRRRLTCADNGEDDSSMVDSFCLSLDTASAACEGGDEGRRPLRWSRQGSSSPSYCSTSEPSSFSSKNSWFLVVTRKSSQQKVTHLDAFSNNALRTYSQNLIDWKILNWGWRYIKTVFTEIRNQFSEQTETLSFLFFCWIFKITFDFIKQLKNL